MACNETGELNDALYRTNTLDDAKRMCVDLESSRACRFVVLPLTSSDSYQLRSTEQCTVVRLEDTLDASRPLRIVALHTPYSPPISTQGLSNTITCQNATFWEHCWDESGASDALHYECAVACRSELNAFYGQRRTGSSHFRHVDGSKTQCLCEPLGSVVGGPQDRRNWFSMTEYARLFSRRKLASRMDAFKNELYERSKLLCDALVEDVRRRQTGEVFDAGFEVHTLLPTMTVLWARAPKGFQGCAPCADYDGSDCDRFFEAVTRTMQKHRIVATPLVRPPTHPPMEYRRADGVWSDQPPSKEELEVRIGAHLDAVCCIVPRTEQGRRLLGNATTECHRQHCFDDMKRTGLATLGRRLREERKDLPKRSSDDNGRRLEASTSALRPHEHVAIDLLNDHSHPIKGCDHILTHRVRSDAMRNPSHFNEAECALRHVAHRVAEYHEVDVQKVQSVFDTMGKTSIDVFARFASMMVTSSPHTRDESTDAQAAHDAREQELRDELLGSVRQRFGERRMQEDEEPVEDTGDPLPTSTTDSEVDVTRVGQVSRDMHEFAEDTRWMQHEMHGFSRAYARQTSRELRRRNATAFEYGAMEYASSTVTSTVRHEIEQTTTLASMVIGSDGSVTQRTRVITDRARHNVRRVREVRKLIHQSSNQDHGDLFQRHGLPKDAPYVETREETEVSVTRSRRLAEVRNHSARRALHSFLDEHFYVDGLRVQDMPRSPMHKYLVDEIDWIAVADTLRSMAHSERERMRWWSRGQVDEEPPPSGGVASALGLEYLAPTSVGRAMRTLGYAMRHGEAPDWEASLGEVVSTHRRRRLEHEEAPFATRSVMDGRWRTGAVRRLTEDFGTGVFGGTLLVPNSDTTEHIQNNTASLIEAVSSYMIYNVFLCTQRLELHHTMNLLLTLRLSTHACEQAISTGTHPRRQRSRSRLEVESM